MTQGPPAVSHFRDFNLPEPLLKAVLDVGYETPTPIQAQTIPHLMAGLDVLGNAPTGTGKTAAFALPLISRIDLKKPQVQLMVLTPTRELAIQVAEALQKYAVHLPGFHVLPIYGGQEYGGQIRQLKRGVQAVVGTPGRVMDHMRKGTLKLDAIAALVLDEADEMLRMGFIDDVEWILEQMPKERQMALFSATMPKEVQRIARRFLRNPQEIAIQTKTATADTIRQRYWSVTNANKLDALTRILEVEPFDAVLIFVRTKILTSDLAGRLSARGHAAEALNGDMVQKQREQMITRLTKGSLDILVATDVAARGLDVSRISHVINYDIPYDTEAYIHRIGRTGRAGRLGDAILFVAPREERMLATIERATRQKIERLELPTTEMVNNKRIADFKQSISDTLGAGELDFIRGMLAQYQHEHAVPSLDIAAALAKMLIGQKSLLLEEKPNKRERGAEPARPDRKGPPAESKARKLRSVADRPPEGMERYRIEVGHQHEVKPGNIVGAIANEAGLDAEHIGHVQILDDHSLVDLPQGMPKDIFNDLKKAWVCGQRLNISRLGKPHPTPDNRPKNPGQDKPKGAKKSKGKRKNDAGKRHKKDVTP